LVVAQDVATAACGLLNAGYFVRYWRLSSGSRGRRLAAAVLATVSAAAVVEALFSQGLFWSQHGAVMLAQLSPGLWALLRLPLLVATASISIVILRRLLS
jgi:hypothetical protein